MTLHVLEPGLYTLVVDLGRPRYRSLGIPLGGAADRASLALGNALVGNPPDAAALEICRAGPTLQADIELACVVYGAPFEVRVERRGTRDENHSPLTPCPLPHVGNVPVGKTFTLCSGDAVHMGGTSAGLRAYLCVAGGLHVPWILDSRSGLEPVRAGMALPCAASKIHGRWSEQMHFSFAAGATVPWPLRVVAGLQADWFPVEDFYTQEMTVSPASNRMGLRLQGQPLPWPKRELVSEPVCPGSVQVTRDGQCIVLGVDGQTIGGYPKIAQVIQADLDYLGQLRPGDRVRFVLTGLEQATEIYRKWQTKLNDWITRLRTSLEGFPGKRTGEPGT